jgi:outer membrane immunogenic protein
MQRSVLLLTTAAVLAIAAAPAKAADLPVAPPPPAAIPFVQPVYDWTGFYVGVDLGYLFDHVQVSNPLVPLAGTASGHPDSGTFGGHLGYRYQFSNGLVAGLEGDVSWLNGNVSPLFSIATVTGMNEKSNWDASVRGILGYGFDINLLYVTGGVAWINGSGCGFFTSASNFCVTGTNYSLTQTGWTAGVGYAHAFTPNVIARIEYLHADFGTDSFSAVNFVGGTGNVQTTTDKIRVGVEWKFGPS